MFWFVSCHFWQVAFLVLLCLISRLLNKPDDTKRPKNVSLWSSSVSAATTAKESADSLWELFDSETQLYPQCKHWCHCRGQKNTSLMYLFQTWHMIHRSFTDIYLQGHCVVFIINKNKCAVWTIFSWGCDKKETNSPQNAEKLIFQRTFFGVFFVTHDKFRHCYLFFSHWTVLSNWNSLGYVNENSICWNTQFITVTACCFYTSFSCYVLRISWTHVLIIVTDSLLILI